MFGCKHLRQLGLASLLSLLLVSSPLLAAQPDVRLVVDISGSMKRTDPNNLRIPAANLLIDLLPADSQAGIWTFGAYVNMLVPHGAANDAWRANARQKVREINSVALFTDIENAIERASWDLNRPAEGRERHIILLSDGLVDTSEKTASAEKAAENEKSRDHLLRNMVPRLVEAGYTIHTLALSDEADHDLMATLAQRTGGLHAIAYTADDLMPLLLQILNRFVPSEQVPLQGNRFLIDSAINEFTVLVFHAPGATVAIHDPAGQRFSRSESASNIRWHGNDRYTLITVTSPADGEWQIETPEHADNRVTVVSDIRLHSQGFPPTVYRGYPQPVEAWFTEENRVVDRREFLSLLETKVQLNRAGQVLGESSMPLSATAPRYVTQLNDFPQLGEQTLRIEVDGRTFRRQLVHSFNVQDVVAASLQQPDDGSAPRVVLRAQHPELKPADVRFTVTANGEPLTAEYRGDGEWRVDLSTVDRSQPQTLDVQVQGSMNGRALDVNLPALVLPPEAGAVAVAAAAEDTPPSFVAPVEPIAPEPVVPVPLETPAVTESQPAGEGFRLDLSPIESWDDPRMLWIYIALGVANILLFLVAFLMYRRFVNKRRRRQDDEEPMLELDEDDLDTLNLDHDERR